MVLLEVDVAVVRVVVAWWKVRVWMGMSADGDELQRSLRVIYVPYGSRTPHQTIMSVVPTSSGSRPG